MLGLLFSIMGYGHSNCRQVDRTRDPTDNKTQNYDDKKNKKEVN